MQADFERFKELKTTEEQEAFKKEMQDKYNKLPEAQKEAYKKASEAGLKATVNACNDYIERVEEAILRDKLGELPEAISFSYIAKKYFGKGIYSPENLSDCDDTQVMIKALTEGQETIDIMAAGTAMRFLTAYLSVTPGERVITGTARMQQ